MNWSKLQEITKILAKHKSCSGQITDEWNEVTVSDNLNELSGQELNPMGWDNGSLQIQVRQGRDHLPVRQAMSDDISVPGPSHVLRGGGACSGVASSGMMISYWCVPTGRRRPRLRQQRAGPEKQPPLSNQQNSPSWLAPATVEDQSVGSVYSRMSLEVKK